MRSSASHVGSARLTRALSVPQLYLTPDGQNASNPQIVLPPGITAQSVIISFLKELWKHASRIITEQTGSVSDLGNVFRK